MVSLAEVADRITTLLPPPAEAEELAPPGPGLCWNPMGGGGPVDMGMDA